MSLIKPVRETTPSSTARQTHRRFLILRGRVAIERPHTQKDVADCLGLTRQSLQREIKELKAARLIGREQRQWCVEDLAALQRLA